MTLYYNADQLRQIFAFSFVTMSKSENGIIQEAWSKSASNEANAHVNCQELRRLTSEVEHMKKVNKELNDKISSANADMTHLKDMIACKEKAFQDLTQKVKVENQRFADTNKIETSRLNEEIKGLNEEKKKAEGRIVDMSVLINKAKQEAIIVEKESNMKLHTSLKTITK